MTPDAAVRFFKENLGNPQDVEHFIVGKQTLWERPVQPEAQKHIKPPSTNDFREMFFVGARSGSNYFVRQIASPDSPIAAAVSGFIGGRIGTNAYQAGPNSVTMTGENSTKAPANPTAQMADALQLIIDQFLGVGLPAIDPRTRGWQGGKFSARNERGWAVTGELTLSNQLPASLTVAFGENVTPSKLMLFAYPSPPDLLGGYPSRITICIPEAGVMKPWQLLNYYEVRRATGSLPTEVFAASRHLGTNVVYTNVYAGGNLHRVIAGNRMLPVNSAPWAQMSRPAESQMRRVVVLACLGVITAVPLLWSLWHFRKKVKS